MNVDSHKLDLVAVWPEADIFSSREKAALEWAEYLTSMGSAAASGEAPAHLRTEFSETEIVFLTVSVANINAWNRIAGPLHFSPLNS